jgi:plastocyanin
VINSLSGALEYATKNIACSILNSPLEQRSASVVRLLGAYNVSFDSGRDQNMRRFLTSIRCSTVFCCMVVLAALIAPQAVPSAAAQVQATAGAQSKDKGSQALAFLPNELWIHAGESVTWTLPTDEIHTVTFLRPGQVRPPFQLGCPGTTPDGSAETTASCVNSGPLANVGPTTPTYTVQFPDAGNFKLVCLVHANMTGVVHVLTAAEALPHDQAFYNREARQERTELLSDGARLEARGIAIAERTFREHEKDDEASRAEVTVGIGEIVAPTGGGSDTVSVMRFLQGRIVVRVGDTVEWTNLDPVTPHTVTFGTEPANPVPPSPGVIMDSDGARRGIVISPTDSTNSGLLAASPQDQTGSSQPPPGVTRFRVTFTSPGTFNYICALHDDLGMTGTVIVK